MAQQKERFLAGTGQNGLNGNKAEHVFDLIEKFGGYGFNKSHSVAYAMIAYFTAYLKAHYPVQFMAALLTEDMGSQDKTIKNIAECKEMNIPILPPDINESQVDFSVVGESIRFGLAAVKNVGFKAVEAIVHERERKGSFVSLRDFCKRVDKSKVNRRVLEGLIQCGAFDFTRVFRSRLFASLNDAIAFGGISEDPNQLNMFDLFLSKEEEDSSFEPIDIDEWADDEKLRKEKESLGFYITGHPLDRFADVINQFTTTTTQDLVGVKDKSTVKLAGLINTMRIKRTRKGEKMAIINVEDKKGFTEVVVFPDVFARCVTLLNDDRPLLITGDAEVSDNTAKIRAQDIVTLETVKQRTINSIVIPVSQGGLNRSSLMKLKDLIFRYPGECQLKFRVNLDDNNKATVATHNRYSIMPEENLIKEIESLVGAKVICEA
jgi:DNA polymerase-3 subunit alpha